MWSLKAQSLCRGTQEIKLERKVGTDGGESMPITASIFSRNANSTSIHIIC